VFNRIIAGLTRLGVSVFGSRVLEVRGRTSGLPRRTPVNLLKFEGGRYLVAPRGDTQWARNLRAAEDGALLVGWRRESFTATELSDEEKPPLLRAYLHRWAFEVGVFFTATELSDEEKPPLLRAYLHRWAFEVGVFFDGVGPRASEEELRSIAPKHPVFRLGSSAR
jgi:deazaflavin-dependent oxidoreductase (nitroreductase family)